MEIIKKGEGREGKRNETWHQIRKGRREWKSERREIERNRKNTEEKKINEWEIEGNEDDNKWEQDN